MSFLVYLKGRDSPIKVDARFITESTESDQEPEERIRFEDGDREAFKGFVDASEVQAILPADRVNSTSGDHS